MRWFNDKLHCIFDEFLMKLLMTFRKVSCNMLKTMQKYISPKDIGLF